MRFVPLAAIALAATAAHAGPLVPPVGPVTPTAKPLAEIEPRIPITGQTVITSPGSYYLTDFISISSGIGITIEPGIDVVIDLNGYGIYGFNAAQHAIKAEEGFFDSNVTIRNGVVKDFTGDAILAEANITLRVEDVAAHASDNGFNAKRAHFVRCEALENRSRGFFVVGDASFDHCTAVGNTRSGFWAASATFRTCEARNNGTRGFFVNGDAVIADCIATENGTNGFEIGNATISNSVAANNDEDGFQALGTTIAHNSSARRNARFGFNIGDGSKITACAASDNGSVGFQIGIDSAIADSIAEGHDQVGSIGISASSGTTIDACHVTNNYTGILATTRCLVIRCRASGNVNHYTMASASFGTIINRQFGSGAFASSDVFANIIY